MKEKLYPAAPYRILNRDLLKFLAIFTMLLNHIAAVFLPEGTFVHQLLTDIGYFTAPTMCYFLVEGYVYTSSRKRYGLRLLFFAILAQLPFSLAFHTTHWNMLFSLLLCFLILVCRDQITDSTARDVAIFLLLMLSLFSDWPLFAPVFTLLFAANYGSRQGLKKSCLFCFSVFFLGNLPEYLELYSFPDGLLCCLAASVSILLSGFCILYLYNGEQAKAGHRFSKWFFYFFYPIHLWILVILR